MSSSGFRAEGKGDNPYIYVFAFVSGIALSFAFPGRDLSFLAWFAMIPFITLLTDCSRKIAFKAGIIFGIPFFFGTQYWIYYSINHYGHMNIVLSFTVILLLCLYESLYTGIFAVLTNYISEKSVLPLVLTAPTIWICIEFARGYIFTGFPWSFLGYSQYKLLPLIQIADITGVYGVSFLIVAVNSVVADFIILKKRQKRIPLYPSVPAYTGAVVLIILISLSFLYGYHHLNKSETGKKIKVAIIQGNIEQDKKWDTQYQESVFSTYISLTKKASTAKPDLIVWPETSAPFIFGLNKKYTERLIDFQKYNKIPLLFGSIKVKSKKNGNYKLTNSAVLLNNNGKEVYTYDKIHLVPFGEYVPLKSLLFFVNKMVDGIGDYVPGNSFHSAKTAFGNFSTVICYELIFPSLVRTFFLKGGDFLVTITNDAWFGNTIGPVQHFYTGVFRAIENRKPVIRAANSGISGFINSRGRVIKKSELFKREVLISEITKDSEITFYTKYGDIFAYLCIVTVALIVVNLMFYPRSRFGGKKW
ncbi:apolipoprotein N-acyltransferase [bacterium BMS3Abin07]|nr:apolipoprotein N-acyltransferase [bacterium BMS3Abin07]GBE32333.1 apolipoprotein N-acyltransferase [bacterium BMS3Bbin05]HDO22826.1 apolipoprotein N-acyltransferase [Nitrospirota bacterium]HDZ87666.1 apolipoprotein N-acyltransferase [Nitrospirota bacterium]